MSEGGMTRGENVAIYATNQNGRSIVAVACEARRLIEDLQSWIANDGDIAGVKYDKETVISHVEQWLVQLPEMVSSHRADKEQITQSQQRATSKASTLLDQHCAAQLVRLAQSDLQRSSVEGPAKVLILTGPPEVLDGIYNTRLNTSTLTFRYLEECPTGGDPLHHPEKHNVSLRYVSLSDLDPDDMARMRQLLCKKFE